MYYHLEYSVRYFMYGDTYRGMKSIPQKSYVMQNLTG